MSCDYALVSAARRGSPPPSLHDFCNEGAIHSRHCVTASSKDGATPRVERTVNAERNEGLNYTDRDTAVASNNAISIKFFSVARIAYSCIVTD